MDDYMSEKLTDIVEFKYVTLAIIGAIIIEYITIVDKCFTDFPNAWSSIQLYFPDRSCNRIL
jgi:hypothetical protein